MSKKKYTFNENLFNLTSGQFVSKLGDKFYSITLAFWVLDNTKSILLMGSVILISQLPSAFLEFFIKPSENANKKRTALIFADILRGLTVLSIALIYYLNLLNFGLIIISQVFLSVLTAFYKVNSNSIIPNLVENNNLNASIEKINFILSFTLILGPFIGSLSASFIGYGFIFIFNGGSFFLAVLFYYFIDLDEVINITTINSPVTKTFIKKIQIQKNTSLIVKTLILTSFFTGALQIIIPYLTLNIIDNNVMNLGFLWGSFNIGSTIVSSFLPHYKFNKKDFKVLFTLISISGSIFIFLGFLTMIKFKLIYIYIIICIILGISISFINIRCNFIFNQLLHYNKNNTSSLLFSNFSLPVFSFLFSLILLNLRFYISIITFGTIFTVIGMFLNLIFYKIKTYNYY